MLAPTKKLQTMYNVRPEDRALLESNPSVGLDAGGWTGASDCRTPPPSRPSIGRKAINSRPESGARRKPKKPIYQTPVGHMSVSSGLWSIYAYFSGPFRTRLRSKRAFGPSGDTLRTCRWDNGNVHGRVSLCGGIGFGGLCCTRRRTVCKSPGVRASAGSRLA